MSDQQQAGTEQSGTPANAEWKATFAGDNADVLKALDPYQTPADFYKAFTETSAEVAKLKEAGQLDWRKAVSGGDETIAKLLDRYAAPDAFGKAHHEAVKKISAGEFAKPLPKDAKPEQIAEWRKANGIPEKPDQYFEKLPNGRVIGTEDKPLFDSLAARLHARNAPPDLVHEIVDFYYADIVDKETTSLADADKKEAQDFEDAMRKAWGDDYRSNFNHLNNWMEGLPDGVKKALDGFGADGRKLKNNPDVMQWMAGLAREFNPAGFVTPGGNESVMQSIDQELAKLTQMSADQHSEYWKGPMADKHQKRMRELLTAKGSMSKRVA